jgi:hypothetical protein
VGRPRWRRSLNQHGTAKHASRASHLLALLHARTEQLFRAPKPQMRVRRGQGSPTSAAVVCVSDVVCMCVGWEGSGGALVLMELLLVSGKNEAHVMLGLEGAVAEPASLLPCPTLPCPALPCSAKSRDGQSRPRGTVPLTPSPSYARPL